MTHADEPFGVGVVGLSALSRFCCERLSLRGDLRLVARWAEDGTESAEAWQFSGVASAECFRYLLPTDVLKAPEVRVVYFVAGSPVDEMIEALARAKSIVVEAPHLLSRQELERLAAVATGCSQVAATYQPRRWDSDFQQARAAVLSGRLGRLLRLRYIVHDSRLPGELFATGVDRELGAPVLDQLRQLIGSAQVTTPETPVSVAWRHFASDRDRSEGFLAHFEFANDLSAVIEIQTGSLLGFRSGWMIEGTDGSYHSGRLYTRTADGEIVDEPLPTPPVTGDAFFDALVAALRGRASDLPTVREAALVAKLLSDAPSGE